MVCGCIVVAWRVVWWRRVTGAGTCAGIGSARVSWRMIVGNIWPSFMVASVPLWYVGGHATRVVAGRKE